VRAPEPPSGAQWTIRHGAHEAVVVEVGGGLRSYAHDGHPVLAGYGVDEQCSAGRGQLLMPWPNRVRDGRYSFAGKDYQLALSEPARHNAIHGLVRWAMWTLLEHEPDRVVVGYRLRPQQGWGASLDLEVAHELSADGLTVTPRARNVGAAAAPFGFGAHPYLTAGEDRVDDLDLRLPARTRLTVDDRLLPVGTEPVDGSPSDFREGRRLGDTQLDTAYTDLETGADGRWQVLLGGPGGRQVTLWADRAYPWVQVFTGDSLGEEQRRRSGVAVEPMTCPPDALRTGDGLVVLQPGEEFSAPWGVTPSAR
jgi:aldose 1-epimerase